MSFSFTILENWQVLLQQATLGSLIFPQHQEILIMPFMLILHGVLLAYCLLSYFAAVAESDWQLPFASVQVNSLQESAVLFSFQSGKQFS